MTTARLRTTLCIVLPPTTLVDPPIAATTPATPTWYPAELPAVVMSMITTMVDPPLLLLLLSPERALPLIPTPRQVSYAALNEVFDSNDVCVAQASHGNRY